MSISGLPRGDRACAFLKIFAVIGLVHSFDLFAVIGLSGVEISVKDNLVVVDFAVDYLDENLVWTTSS